MHIYLFRHAQSEENARGWDGSNTNSPLTALGQQQAYALADWVAQNLQLNCLYVSTMRRTRQTAQVLIDRLGLEAQFDDRLREVGNNYPDGRPYPDDALPSLRADIWGSLHPYQALAPNVENWMQFRTRVGNFLESLTQPLPPDHEYLQVGVVCHGGVIEGVFEHLFLKGPYTVVAVNTFNTGVTYIEYRPQADLPAWWLHYHNQTRHLPPDLITI
jgi:broad specificity phosphatase PhoE